MVAFTELLYIPPLGAQRHRLQLCGFCAVTPLHAAYHFTRFPTGDSLFHCLHHLHMSIRYQLLPTTDPESLSSGDETQVISQSFSWRIRRSFNEFERICQAHAEALNDGWLDELERLGGPVFVCFMLLRCKFVYVVNSYWLLKYWFYSRTLKFNSLLGTIYCQPTVANFPRVQRTFLACCATVGSCDHVGNHPGATSVRWPHERSTFKNIPCPIRSLSRASLERSLRILGSAGDSRTGSHTTLGKGLLLCSCGYIIARLRHDRVDSMGWIFSTVVAFGYVLIISSTSDLIPIFLKPS